MFLPLGRRPMDSVSFPRVRGDVPQWDDRTGVGIRFSPRARGCSHIKIIKIIENSVFPACAGMFLILQIFHVELVGFPRVRGDVPSC